MTPADLERLARQRGGTVRGVNAAALLAGANHALPPPRNEAEFQSRVLNEAIARGFLAMHIRPVRVQRKGGEVYFETPTQGSPGFPDTVIVGHGKAYVWELKMPGKKPTHEQSAWLDALRCAGVSANVFYPEHSAEILAALGDA